MSNKNAETLADLYIVEDCIHKHSLLSERTLMKLGMIKYSAEGEFVKKVDARVNEDAKLKCKPEQKAPEKEVRDILQKHKKML